MPELIVIGAGEHGRVVIDAALTRPDVWRVIGFMDRQLCEETASRLGINRLGSDDDVSIIRQRYRDAYFVVGVGALGEPATRERIVSRFDAEGVRWATVVHRDASVASTARLSEGTVAFARAVINTGARIGRHCVINSGAVVEHDVIVGDYSQIAPAAALGGGARVGSRSYVALGSRVRDHVTIGDRVFVAMGAVVVSNVEDGSEVVGIPARRVDRSGREA